MNTTAYRFGQIDIDGQSYHSDVIITPEGVIASWWREHGHGVAAGDLAEIIAAKPEILVVGTGYLARTALSEEARERGQHASAVCRR